jgi:hypothetical protein
LFLLSKGSNPYSGEVAMTVPNANSKALWLCGPEWAVVAHKELKYAQKLDSKPCTPTA